MKIGDDTPKQRAYYGGDWVYYRLDVPRTANLNLSLDWTNPFNSLDLGLFDPNGTLTNVSLNHAPEMITVDNPLAGNWTVAINAYRLEFTPETYTLEIGKPGGRPVANFTYTPPTPTVNQSITFDASNSHDPDPDGGIIAYTWDFGDGNITETTETTINHSYLIAGYYLVNLTVTDNDGAMGSTSKVVTVATLSGDVNHDGAVTSEDVVIVLEMAVRGEWNEDADVSDDDRITSLDALMILQLGVGCRL